jgi:hypothetical protein
MLRLAAVHFPVSLRFLRMIGGFSPTLRFPSADLQVRYSNATTQKSYITPS